MRNDTEVAFISQTDDRYDPDLGEWVEGEEIRTSTEANVTDLGTETSVKLFGDIQERALVIRTQRLFVLPKFDTVEIGEKSYKQLTSRKPLERNTLIVKEVVSDGQKS